MAEIQLLGLFQNVEQASDAIERLHRLGVPEDKVTVMSGIPYKPEMLGRPKPKSRVGLIALIGAFLGVLTALVLSVGLFLLYPLRQGGQPIAPIPPTLIVIFEVTMLGTMWSSFFALLGESRFPIFKPQLYDARITAGSIGVLAEVAELLGGDVRDSFNEAGAYEVKQAGASPRLDTGFRRFWTVVAAALGVFLVVSLLFFYDVVRIPFPSNMVEQDSIAYDEGPRLVAPALAVPIQGPVLVAGVPASEPVPASADSLQRGQVLFDLVCRMCHGAQGKGDGTVGAFFAPTKPADLTGQAVQSLPDSQIFLVITQGFGVMPSMAENLSAGQRWDVINFVRTLK